MARALFAALVLLGACAAPPASRGTPTPTDSPSPTASPTASATATPTPTPALVPIFDAHLHYSRESWSTYPPEKVATILDAAGVRSALVSSAPDAGTFKLRAALGERIIPMLSPYRNGADVFSWTRDGSIPAYVESAYRADGHRGFGEFHLNAGQTTLPVVQSVLAFARRKDLFLQPHADARALAELLDVVGPEYTVLWAHAGVTATPEQIDALLAKWPKLWAELSLRDDVAPSGELDPRWRALLLKYPDRFMVGTDTWTVGGSFTGNERWDTYAAIVARIRGWLKQLPADAAEKIAHSNGERFMARLRP